MPRDPFSVRTPSFRAKLAQIKGLSGDEKALFQRVGNLIDVLTITQRQAANPRGQTRKVGDRVPRPQNISAVGVTGGVQVSWDPVDISELQVYEIDIGEAASFANAKRFQSINTTISSRGVPQSGSLFVRVRTVAKNGDTSRWTATVSVAVPGSSIFRADQDSINPENRTTVSPKPTLLGADLDVDLGTKAFVGAGAVIGPSPLTVDNQHSGYELDIDLRHDISADIYESATPFPSIQQRSLPGVLEYIDEDPFYSFDPSFYMRPTQLPSHLADFFDNVALTLDPSSLDIEYLRYRLVGSFYFPSSPQTGIVQSATMGSIIF